MNTLMQATLTNLEWREPVAQEPRYELHFEDEVLATLVFEPLCRTLATAKTREGTWTFLQTGILSSTFYIRQEGSRLDLAEFHPAFLGRGLLRFSKDESYSWRREPHHGGWSFYAADGERLVTLCVEPPPPKEPWPHREQAEVRLGPAGLPHPRVSLLMAFGWYLLLQRQ
ncbi:hypothetical protein GETHLI_04940 [Geothrix limicola]|uniref:Uncharacterized protein n=1 Tax=Geothrix limicola TaxID=2927978 RepID=A0ABQ5QB00_9BACT|nr:hypothetical protein [Geothrix limicola]GLH71992.1 hypothetical protein GETHLI_04940 [Geothrix limicola]